MEQLDAVKTVRREARGDGHAFSLITAQGRVQGGAETAKLYNKMVACLVTVSEVRLHRTTPERLLQLFQRSVSRQQLRPVTCLLFGRVAGRRWQRRWTTTVCRRRQSLQLTRW